MKVRFNAIKHGMRAKTIVLEGEDTAAYDARLQAWTIDLAPRDDLDRFLVTRAVDVSWKLDRLHRILEARRLAARFADADRLAAQAEVVVALGRRLYFDPVGPLCLYPHAPTPSGGEAQRVSWSGDPGDPDDPTRIVVQLEAMTLGCAWLLDRWGELRELLECGLIWQPHDRLKAVRMLGRQPLDAPDDRRVMLIYLCGWAMDPRDQHGFSDMANELGPGERKVFVERLNEREAMMAMPPDENAARATLLALIAEEEERLDGILTSHLEREEAEAEAELAFDTSAEGERLRRYEAEYERALLRIIETLRKRHQAADGPASPGGRASAAPTPIRDGEPPCEPMPIRRVPRRTSRRSRRSRPPAPISGLPSTSRCPTGLGRSLALPTTRIASPATRRPPRRSLRRRRRRSIRSRRIRRPRRTGRSRRRACWRASSWLCSRCCPSSPESRRPSPAPPSIRQGPGRTGR